MKKYEYTGKTLKEAIDNAKIGLQELEENLIINEKETKTGLFNKKVIIEVIRKDEVTEFIKEYVKELLKNIGVNANLELKKRNDSINITVFSDNNAILIGKNGKNKQSGNVSSEDVSDIFEGFSENDNFFDEDVL